MECEENFEAGVGGVRPIRRRRAPAAQATGAACEMCALGGGVRSDAGARRKHPPSARRALPRVACGGSRLLNRSAKAMRTCRIPQTKSTSRMHITMRYPMTAPGSPVKFTNRIGRTARTPFFFSAVSWLSPLAAGRRLLLFVKSHDCSLLMDIDGLGIFW